MCVERDITPSVTQLANLNEEMTCECHNNVHLAGKCWEMWQVKFRSMRGVHDGAIWVADGDWMSGRDLIDDGSVDGAEVCSTASIGKKE
jgi:hypothetical protein